MDIKRRHVAEGLIRPRIKRAFGTMNSDLIQPSIPSILPPPNSEPTPSAAEAQPTRPLPSTEPLENNGAGTLDIANFDNMAEELVQAATESDQLTQEEQDTGEDLPTPPPNPPTQPGTSSRTTGARPSKTKIPLKSLFRFPTDPDAPAEGLNFYWKWGIKHLEEEMLVAELMTDGLEDIDDAQ